MPTLANTSRTQLRYILESVYGTTPGAGNGTNLRMTGESLDFALSKESSKEIRSDRQKSDLVVVDAGAQGGFNFELSYIEFDPFFEALMQDTWVKHGTNGVTGTAFSATFAATTITAGVAPTGNDAFTNLQKGQWFLLNAPSDPNDGKYFQVDPDTAPTATVITVSALTPLTAGGPVAGTTIATSRLVNGTTERSFTLEKEFSDITQFFGYRGMGVSKGTLNFQSGAILTGMFDFMGKDGVRSAATTLPGSPVASQTFAVMNAVSGVGSIIEGGAALTGTFIKSLSLELDNKPRGRKAIGNLGNVSIGFGTLDFKGNMEVYLVDGTLYDKFLNNTSSSLSLRATDDAGNGYIFTLPKIKYGDAKVTAGAIDQDAMLTIPFEAILDDTAGATGKTVLIDRVGVAG